MRRQPSQKWSLGFHSRSWICVILTTWISLKIISPLLIVGKLALVGNLCILSRYLFCSFGPRQKKKKGGSQNHQHLHTRPLINTTFAHINLCPISWASIFRGLRLSFPGFVFFSFRTSWSRRVSQGVMTRYLIIGSLLWQRLSLWVFFWSASLLYFALYFRPDQQQIL